MTISESEVKSYLNANPDFLEDYVLRNIPQDTIEKWTIRKVAQYNKCKILFQLKDPSQLYLSISLLFQQPWTALRTSPSGVFVCTPTNGLYFGNLLQVIAYLLSLSLLLSLPLLHPKEIFRHNSILK